MGRFRQGCVKVPPRFTQGWAGVQNWYAPRWSPSNLPTSVPCEGSLRSDLELMMGAKLQAQAQQVRKKTEGEGGCAECRERCDSAYGHWPTRTRPVTGAPFVAVGNLAHRWTNYAPGLFERGCQVVATSHLSLAWRAEPAGISVSVVTSLLTTVGLVALLYAHARTVRKTSFVVMTGFALTARRLLQGYAVPSVVYSGLQAFAKTSPPEKVPRKPPPLKGGRGISGLGFPENRENGEFRGVRLAISTPHCSPARHAPPAP